MPVPRISVKSFRRRSGNVNEKKDVRLEQKREYIAAEVKSNPIAEGGMRFTFPPYGKKIEVVSLQYGNNCKLAAIYTRLQLKK
jgi:hypothetical protein